MITDINEFIICFFSTYSVIELTERDDKFSCKITANSYSPKEASEISSKFKFLNSRDSFIFSIIFGDADPISINSNSINFEEFLTNLGAEYSHQNGETINAEIVIDKSNILDTITIYDLDAFYTTLVQSTTEQAFVIFNRAFSGKEFLFFEVSGLINSFSTASITFMSIGGSPRAQINLSRSKILDNVKLLCHYSHPKHTLIPDDFNILSYSSENNTVKNLIDLFNHYKTILSVIYLFDITSLKSDELEYKINGYKAINGIVDLKNKILPETSDYFNIYSWVYNGGNLNDKIGLARNIVSLHFKKNGQLELGGNPFQAIQSGYKVYEKQNIKQYIEVRNKISDQLLDFNNRANKIVETFASGFQKSALALITFYLSAITIKVLGKGDGEFLNLFTLDATVLSITVLFGCVVYFYVSRWEVKNQKLRFVNSYTNLKERYTDLLDPDDIKRILNDNKEFNQDLAFIDSKLKVYSWMWGLIIVALFSSTLFLFFVYNVSQIVNIPLFKWILYNGCGSD